MENSAPLPSPGGAFLRDGQRVLRLTVLHHQIDWLRAFLRTLLLLLRLRRQLLVLG